MLWRRLTDRAMALCSAVPDDAVLDVRLPDGNGIELCRELLDRLPNLKTMMLTSFTEDQAMLDAILAGASGYRIFDDHEIVERLRRAGVDDVEQTITGQGQFVLARKTGS